MTAKKRPVRKSGNNNQLFIFLAIVIIMVIISIVVAYFMMDKEHTNDPEVKINQAVSEAVTQIEGTWVSNYDGTMLTIIGLTFTQEVSGVDAAPKMTGSIAVEGNIVTFVFTTGNKVCQGMEGHYLYAIEENGDLFFKLIKDGCNSRQERMTATWFKL